MIDECGVCGGPGIEDPFCDCESNVEDECGVCGGDGSTCAEGCTDPVACNYDPAAGGRTAVAITAAAQAILQESAHPHIL